MWSGYELPTNLQNLTQNYNRSENISKSFRGYFLKHPVYKMDRCKKRRLCRAYITAITFKILHDTHLWNFGEIVADRTQNAAV